MPASRNPLTFLASGEFELLTSLRIAPVDIVGTVSYTHLTLPTKNEV